MQLKLGKVYYDSTNKAIYLFTRIEKQALYGLYWQARPITIKSGSWDKNKWLDFFSSVRSDRFVPLNKAEISNNRRHKMVSQIFELRLNL